MMMPRVTKNFDALKWMKWTLELKLRNSLA